MGSKRLIFAGGLLAALSMGAALLFAVVLVAPSAADGGWTTLLLDVAEGQSGAALKAGQTGPPGSRDVADTGADGGDETSLATRVWPLNGVVENRSSQALQVYDCDDAELRELQPMQQGSAAESTGSVIEDFDYFAAEDGVWHKVGPHRVVVTDENLSSAGECVTRRCKPCDS